MANVELDNKIVLCGKDLERYVCYCCHQKINKGCLHHQHQQQRHHCHDDQVDEKGAVRISKPTWRRALANWMRLLSFRLNQILTNFLQNLSKTEHWVAKKLHEVVKNF